MDEQLAKAKKKEDAESPSGRPPGCDETTSRLRYLQTQSGYEDGESPYKSHSAMKVTTSVLMKKKFGQIRNKPGDRMIYRSLDLNLDGGISAGEEKPNL